VAGGGRGEGKSDRPARLGTDNPERRQRAAEASSGGGRVYDRHSGTGRGREEKKGGAGGHNWGSATDEAESAIDDVRAGDSSAAAPAASAVPDEEAIAAAAAKKAEEEAEARQMTLSEYRRIQSEKSVKADAKPVRAANAGAGNNLWSDSVLLERVDETAANATKDAPAKQRKEKNVVDFGDVFKAEPVRRERSDRDDRRGEGGRGGRGGGRGGDRDGSRGGRGGYGGRGNSNSGGAGRPNVADTSSFPILGSK